MLSFNIHASGVSNWDQLNTILSKIRPAYALIMDFDNKRALPLQQQHPYTKFILRVPQPHNIESSWDGMSSSDWVEWLWARSGNGALIMQWLNEPVGYGDARTASRWSSKMAETAILARAKGLTLAGPNFAVGNPDTRLIEQGVFDTAIREWIRNNHVLALHEYAVRGSIAPGYHIGRFSAWVRRAVQLGAKRPQIVITETGYDIHGNTSDGYKNHISSESYADMLKQISAFYKAGGGISAACIFCYGSDGNWNSFDIQHDKTVLDAIELQEIPSVMRKGRLRTPGTWVNVRESPSVSSRALGHALRNQEVEYTDEGDWYGVQFIVKGYINKQNGAVYFVHD